MHFNIQMCQFKVVILGEATVGKSSILIRFVKGQFSDNLETTIGAAFLTQSVLDENTQVKFEIWDTAGQERYRSLAPMYYRTAQIALVVYDITNANSFEMAKSWLRELHDKAPSLILTCLVANKLDLEESRAIPYSMGKELADECGIMFFETSAKLSLNINTMFNEIARKMPRTATASNTGDPRLASSNRGTQLGASGTARSDRDEDGSGRKINCC